jgi:hypothetical protein
VTLAHADFDERAKSVRSYLISLRALEKSHGIAGQGSFVASATLAASRAAAFIMIYNCVEFAAREALVEIRSDIAAGAIQFVTLKDHWREEIVRAHFYDRLQQGTNHVTFLKEIAKFMPGRVDWLRSTTELPFPGNIDNEEILRLVKRIGYHWRPPKKALGGVDLQLVRKMRNDLAHGLETFEAIGSRYSANDILQKFDRIKAFLSSFIRMLERYRTKQLYLAV